jgi:hypothetical protein
MLAIDRTAQAPVSVPPERCMELLADVEGYPRWSSLIKSAEPAGERVRIRAELLGVSFEMECALDVGPDGAVLHRIPHGDDDPERFEATWTVGAGRVALHVVALMDAPGPARLIKGRVEKRLADDLLADFTRAL